VLCRPGSSRTTKRLLIKFLFVIFNQSCLCSSPGSNVYSQIKIIVNKGITKVSEEITRAKIDTIFGTVNYHFAGSGQCISGNLYAGIETDGVCNAFNSQVSCNLGAVYCGNVKAGFRVLIDRKKSSEARWPANWALAAGSVTSRIFIVVVSMINRPPVNLPSVTVRAPCFRAIVPKCAPVIFRPFQSIGLPGWHGKLQDEHFQIIVYNSLSVSDAIFDICSFKSCFACIACQLKTHKPLTSYKFTTDYFFLMTSSFFTTLPLVVLTSSG